MISRACHKDNSTRRYGPIDSQTFDGVLLLRYPKDNEIEVAFCGFSTSIAHDIFSPDVRAEFDASSEFPSVSHSLSSAPVDALRISQIFKKGGAEDVGVGDREGNVLLRCEVSRAPHSDAESNPGPR